MDIKVLELDPFNFLIWSAIIEEAKNKRSRMTCDWTPFISAYQDILSETRLPKAQGITREQYQELLIDYYVNRDIPMNQVATKHPLSVPSLNKRVQAFMFNFIDAVRDSLLPYPCHEYSVHSKEVHPGKNPSSNWATDFMFYGRYIAARSGSEAIEIVHQYVPKTSDYTLIANQTWENKDLIQPAIRFI